MREGLDAPTLQLPADNVAEIRGFLDGQSRVKLAVWVRHEQQGADGPSYDHHLVLGVADEDWPAGDMRALEEGMQLPALATGEPTWVDIFPVSEVETLRAFATVLWEQSSLGEDPLDYRFTYEPFAPDAAAVERFAVLLARQPAIRSVGATVEKLWKGTELVEARVQLLVDADFRADALTITHDAARETVLAGWRSSGTSIGRPTGDTTAILYEATA